MRIAWRGLIKALWGREPGKPAGSPVAGSALAQHRIALLLVAQDYALQESLSILGIVRGWDVLWTPSVEEAVAALRQRPIPLVICDEEAPGGWRSIIERIASLPGSTCVLLASRFCDEALRREANRHYAYDVIAKPLNWEQVTDLALFAWSWYTSGCAAWWGPQRANDALRSG